MGTSAILSLAVTDHPTFNPLKYALFRREVIWWGDLHANIPDVQIVLTLALKVSGDLLKGLITRYMGKPALFLLQEHSLIFSRC